MKKHFKIDRKDTLKAVDGISFTIKKGETLGLVGESGCGKSTVGRTITQIYQPTSGEIIFNNEDVHAKYSKAEQKKKKRDMQMIFQDPYSSLNPRMTVMEIISEGLLIHATNSSVKDREQKVNELLELVGLNKNHSGRYPHEFSGGKDSE